MQLLLKSAIPQTEDVADVETVGLLVVMRGLFKQNLKVGRCGSFTCRSLIIRIRYATCRAEAREEEREKNARGKRKRKRDDNINNIDERDWTAKREGTCMKPETT
jgi:hypothetical protein